MIMLVHLFIGLNFVNAVQALPGVLEYVCDDEGNITIKTNQSGMKPYLVYGEGCQNGTGGDGHPIFISGCKVGKQMMIVIEQVEENGILKKGDLKEYSLQCDHERLSYNLTVTAKHGIIVPSSFKVHTNPIQINTVTARPSERYLPNMEILKVGGGTDITIGDNLTLTISKNIATKENTSLLALDCTAKPFSPSVKQGYAASLWTAYGCTHHDLFPGNWTITEQAITHSLKAFRFENSKIVSVTCSVRICPDGDPKRQCDLKSVCKTNSGRKRRETEENHLNLSAHFTVKTDVDSLTSGKGCHGIRIELAVLGIIVHFLNRL